MNLVSYKMMEMVEVKVCLVLGGNLVTYIKEA